MSTLRYYLHHMPPRDVRAIITRLDLRKLSGDGKLDRARVIEDFWLDSAQRTALLGGLSDSAKAVLHQLAHVETLPAPLFWAQYGTIRRAGENYPPSESPWLHPQTLSEELYYVGLIHAGRHRGKRKSIYKAEAIAVPDDLRPWLLDIVYETVALQPAADSLLHDLAQLLIYVHEQGGVRLLQGRWLPPRHLQGVGPRLSQAVDNTASHKQQLRLRFLAFLAQAGQLLSDGQVTPLGWHWLAQPPAQRLAMVWEAWVKASADLRQAYDLPGAFLPQPWQTLLNRLLRQQAGVVIPARFAAYLLSLEEFQPYFIANFEDIYAIEEVIAEIFGADLCWLGVLEAQTTDGVNVSSPLRQPYQITMAGAWLLHPIGEPPPLQTHRLLAETVLLSPVVDDRQGWQVQLPTDGLPLLQARVAAYSVYEVQPDAYANGVHGYRLNRASLARAASRGEGLPALLETLAALGIPVSPEVHARLAEWYGDGERFHIQPVLLLRSRSRQEMGWLYTQPGVSEIVGEVLAPTAAMMTTSAQIAGELLARQEIFINAGEALHDALATGDASQEGAHWLAGRVYALLAGFLTLPFPASTLRLDEIWQRLSGSEQAVLSAQLEGVEASLRSLLDGFVPAPPTPGDPTRWLPTLEAAIAAESTLTVFYFSAGRNLLTRRIIQPYWLEERRGVLYVRAYCHSAERVLIFRVDRIQGIGD